NTKVRSASSHPSNHSSISGYPSTLPPGLQAPPSCSRLRKGKRKGAAVARFAVELHLGTQIGRPVLDDGEPQSRAAGGMALVHPVKPLEYPALGLPGNADASIRHRDPRAEGGIFHCDGDAAVRP
ncbi:Multiple resistance and pH homeostasis protein C, partial [Dysosmobacter welbionis]